jgi:hypothetical protein
MSILVEWDTPAQHCIRYTYPEHWVWEDFYAARAQARRMMTQRPGPVGEIVILPERFHIPSDIFSHLRRIGQQHPQPVVLSVVVGLPPIAETINQAFSAIYPRLSRTYRLAQSLEEARDIAAQVLGERAAA